jgi:thermitase
VPETPATYPKIRSGTILRPMNRYPLRTIGLALLTALMLCPVGLLGQATPTFASGPPAVAGDRYPPALGDGPTPVRSTAGRLLVKLRPAPLTARLHASATRAEALSELANRLQVPVPRLLFRDGNRTVEVEARALADRLGLDRWLLLELPAGIDLGDEIRRLTADPLVEVAEPDGLGQGAGRPDPTSYRSGVRAAFRTVPDDLHFPDQWYLDQVSDHDIDMPEAWDIQPSATSVIVAVLDTGVDLDHPDLQAALLPGYDFVNNDAVPSDDNGHGSNVAGILGALANNGIGVAKVLDSDNRGYYSDWAQGLRWATDQGARIINLSAGGPSNSTLLHDAVTYAWTRGVTVCASMMNFDSDVPYYPAAFTETIAVGATDELDRRAVPFFWSATSGSSFGPHIDLAAPGSRILSTSYLGGYVEYGGTSQATPLVAATATLLVARDGRLLPEDIRDVLHATAEDGVGPPAEDSPGFDDYFGYGRLNAAAALAAVEPFTPAVERLVLSPPYPNPTSGPSTLALDLPGPASTSIYVYDIRGRRVRTLLAGSLLPAGPSEVAFDGRDDSGHPLPSGIYLVEIRAGSERAVTKLIILR